MIDGIPAPAPSIFTKRTLLGISFVYHSYGIDGTFSSMIRQTKDVGCP